jgi:hypothetical protein
MRRVSLVTSIAISCVISNEAFGQDRNVLAASLASAYRNTLDSIIHIKVNNDVAWGHTLSLENAIAANFVKPPHIGKVKTLKKNDTFRYTVIEDQHSKHMLDSALSAQHKSLLPGLMTGPGVPFSSTDEFVCPSFSFIFDPRSRSANVFQTAETDYEYQLSNYILSPLAIGTRRDFHTVVRNAIARSAIISASLEEDGIAKVSIDTGSNRILNYFVDTKRGSMPIRVESIWDGGKSTTIAIATSYRDISDGRWFPDRVVFFMRQFPGQSPCLSKVYSVTHLNADVPPTDEEMKIAIPAGATILRRNDPQRYFKAKQPETVGPGDLERMYELCQLTKQNPQLDTAISQPTSNRWLWLLVGSIVCFASGLVWHRISRARAAG